MKKILVTGATGRLGSAIIKHLLRKTTQDNVIALVRDWAKADDLIMQGIEVRYGHYDDPATLKAAMQGIDKLMLISGTDPIKRFAQHQNVIDAAVDAGVGLLAYTSIAIKDHENSDLQFLMNSHFDTEAYIRASNINYTILRNTLYAEDLPYYIGMNGSFLTNGIVFYAGDGRIPFALRDEMAEAFADLLLSDEHVDQILHIGNQRYFSFQDIANELTELTGVEIAYTGNDPQCYGNVLREMGLPKHIATFLIHTSEDTRNGHYDMVTNDLAHLLGRAPADLKCMLKKVYSL